MQREPPLCPSGHAPPLPSEKPSRRSETLTAFTFPPRPMHSWHTIAMATRSVGCRRANPRDMFRRRQRQCCGKPRGVHTLGRCLPRKMAWLTIRLQYRGWRTFPSDSRSFRPARVRQSGDRKFFVSYRPTLELLPRGFRQTILLPQHWHIRGTRLRVLKEKLRGRRVREVYLMRG